jgi:hypothetical protein
MPGSSVSFITIKLKAKENFHMATMLLLYVQQNITLTKTSYFSKVCYHTRVIARSYSVTTVTPATQVCASVMLFLLILRN